MSVSSLDEARARLRRAQQGGFSGGPKPPDNGDMEILRRVEKLESLAEKTNERLAALEKDVAVIKSNYSTKADIESVKTAVAEGQTKIIMWVVGAIFLAQILPAIPSILRALGMLK